MISNVNDEDDNNVIGTEIHACIYEGRGEMVEKSARMMVPLNGTMKKTFSQFHPKKTKVKKIQIKKTSPRGWIQRFFPFFSSICSCCCCILFKLLLRTKGRCPIPSSSSTSSAYKISRILSLSLFFHLSQCLRHPSAGWYPHVDHSLP